MCFEWLSEQTAIISVYSVNCCNLTTMTQRKFCDAETDSTSLDWKPSKQHRKFRLEFINNLMHNFIYSIIILHHDPQHVSSIAVLIFRRTTVYLQYLVSSHSVCSAPIKSELQSALDRCTVWQHTEWDDTRYCKYTVVLLKMSTAMLETCWGSWCNIIIE
jgi:hypothetical protein